MSHQRDADRWAKYRRSVAFFMEMRLGKTLPIIRWAMRRSNAFLRLVVMPLSTMGGWENQLSLERRTSIRLTGTREERKIALEKGLKDNVDFFLINPEGLYHSRRDGKKAQPSEIAMLLWDVVIIDESTMIRGPKSVITKTALSCLSLSKYKAVMSGLPNPEGPHDFVTQMLFLNGEFMGCRNFWEWRVRHMICVAYGGWVPKRGIADKVRSEVSKHSFSLTRAQAGVGGKTFYEPRRVALPQKIHVAMLEAVTDMEISGNLAMYWVQIATWLMRICGGRFPGDRSLWFDHKLKEMDYLLTGELKNEPVIIWARYTNELEAIAGWLNKRKISNRLMYSKTKDLIDKYRTEFQEERVRCLVCQPKSVMMGNDFSRAKTAICYSNYADYELRGQLKDRIVDPTCKEPLLIIDLIAEDTVDEDLHTSLRMKKKESELFFNQFSTAIKNRIHKMLKERT